MFFKLIAFIVCFTVTFIYCIMSMPFIVLIVARIFFFIVLKKELYINLNTKDE